MSSPHTATRKKALSPQLEKSPCSNKDPAQPKIKINKIIFKRKKEIEGGKECQLSLVFLTCLGALGSQGTEDDGALCGG